MLDEFRTTAEATKEMSGAVQGAVQSLDAFIARVQEPSKTASAPEEPSRPFDVREYGEAAAKIGGAAAEIGGALKDLDKSQAEIAPLIDQASTKLDKSVARASAFALGVGLALIVAATGAAILVRRIPRASSPRAKSGDPRARGSGAAPGLVTVGRKDEDRHQGPHRQEDFRK